MWKNLVDVLFRMRSTRNRKSSMLSFPNQWWLFWNNQAIPPLPLQTVKMVRFK